MTNGYLPWPYAAKAIVQHEFDVNHLNIWVTFRHPMDQSVKPADGLWLVEVDDVPKEVSASAWQDFYVILLTVPNVVALPDKVTLEYEGPDANLVTTWNKQWEAWSPIISYDVSQPYLTTSFVDRGDPAGYDWTKATLTEDGNWHTLDLSAIIPAGAKAVLLGVRIKDNLVSQVARFRELGNANNFNLSLLYTVAAEMYNSQDCIIALDADRKIEYQFTNTVWSGIYLIVRGWWL